MSLTIDRTFTDLDEWAADLSLVDEWLYVMWGIVPGVNGPRSSKTVHPSSLATAGWLDTMWAFGI